MSVVYLTERTLNLLIVQRVLIGLKYWDTTTIGTPGWNARYVIRTPKEVLQ
jgi:hypothetical protein